MLYLNTSDPASGLGYYKALSEQINGAFGTFPNMFKLTVIQTLFWKACEHHLARWRNVSWAPNLANSSLVSIAEANRCEFCLAAHTRPPSVISHRMNQMKLQLL